MDGADLSSIDHDLMGDPVLVVEKENPHLFLVKVLKRRVYLLKKILSGVTWRLDKDSIWHLTDKPA